MVMFEEDFQFVPEKQHQLSFLSHALHKLAIFEKVVLFGCVLKQIRQNQTKRQRERENVECQFITL